MAIFDNHINREGYTWLYKILENGGLWDHEIGCDDIPKKYIDKGLTYFACRPNYSEKPMFEFMSACVCANEYNIGREIYFSMYKPEYIINMSDIEVTQEEKNALYLYTSENWDMLMNCYRDLYSNDYIIETTSDFSTKDCSKVIYPDKSPDYRLLPEISPKEIIY